MKATTQVLVKLNNGEYRILNTDGATDAECKRQAYVTAFGDEEPTSNSVIDEYCTVLPIPSSATKPK